MLAGLLAAIVALLLYKFPLPIASFIVLACIGVGIWIGWGDEIKTFTLNWRDGVKVVKAVKQIYDDAGSTTLDDLPDATKQTIQKMLSYERKGEALTDKMHFVLGLNAFIGGNMKEADRRFNIVALLRKDSTTYYYWGNTLAYLARMKNDETLYTESFTKYEKAVDIKSDYHEAYYNWGNALKDLAKLKSDEALFRESFTKYFEACSSESNHDYLCSWAFALHACADIVKDKSKRKELLKEAKEKEKKADESDISKAKKELGKAQGLIK